MPSGCWLIHFDYASTEVVLYYFAALKTPPCYAEKMRQLERAKVSIEFNEQILALSYCLHGSRTIWRLPRFRPQTFWNRRFSTGQTPNRWSIVISSRSGHLVRILIALFLSHSRQFVHVIERSMNWDPARLHGTKEARWCTRQAPKRKKIQQAPTRINTSGRRKRRLNMYEHVWTWHFC